MPSVVLHLSGQVEERALLICAVKRRNVLCLLVAFNSYLLVESLIVVGLVPIHDGLYDFSVCPLNVNKLTGRVHDDVPLPRSLETGLEILHVSSSAPQTTAQNKK